MLKFVRGVWIINLFRYRNLALGCLLFLITLYACFSMEKAPMYIIGIACVLILAALWTVYAIKRNARLLNILTRHTLSLILICAAVILGLLIFCEDKEQLKYCDGMLHTVEGEVDEVVFSEEYFAGYILSINKIDGEECDYKVMLTDGSASLSKNDLFKATVSFEILSNREFGFNTADYYLSDGIIMGGTIVEFINITEGDTDIFDFLQGINNFLDKILKKNLNEQTHKIASALFLGNRKLLPDNISRDFTRLGIVHILSLSGMHVSIIVTMLAFALSKSHLPKILQIVIILFSITLFIGISGCSEPAIRAGLMQFVFYFLFIFWDTADTITSLFTSVTLICIFSPYLIFSLSLMLSFLAMLGCICSARILYKSRKLHKIKSKFLRFCIFTAVTTVGVTFFSLPVVEYYFGYVSLFSILSNIVIIPVLNIIIYLVPFILLLSPISFIVDVLSYFCEIICSFALKLCENLASTSDILLYANGDIQKIGVFIIFASCITAIVLSRKRLKLSFIALAVGVLIFVFGVGALHIARSNNIYFTSYSFEGNDVICIENNHALTMIDISDSSLNCLFANDMSKYLGYGEIDNYVVMAYSHKLSRYLDKITDTAIIKRIYLSSPQTEKEEEYFNEAVTLLECKDIEYTVFDNELLFDGISLNVCPDMYISRSTKRSVVFNLKINDFNYTYMGASSFELASTLTDKYAYNADVLVFGDYGPKHKTPFKYSTKNLECAVFMGESRMLADNEFLSSLGEKGDFYEPTTIRIKN